MDRMDRKNGNSGAIGWNLMDVKTVQRRSIDWRILGGI